MAVAAASTGMCRCAEEIETIKKTTELGSERAQKLMSVFDQRERDLKALFTEKQYNDYLQYKITIRGQLTPDAPRPPGAPE